MVQIYRIVTNSLEWIADEQLLWTHLAMKKK